MSKTTLTLVRNMLVRYSLFEAAYSPFIAKPIMRRSISLPLLFLLIFFSSVEADPPVQKPPLATQLIKHHTLIIYSGNNNLPSHEKFREGLLARLNSKPADEQIELYEEYLDSVRLKITDGFDPLFINLWNKKYADVKIDMVVTMGPAAEDLLNRHPELFAHIPRYDISISGLNLDDEKSKDNLLKVINVVFQVLPTTDRLVVVKEYKNGPERLVAQLKAIEPLLAKKIPLEVWNGFSFEELYSKAQQLPPHTAIVYFPVSIDRLGNRQIPFNVIRKLAHVSSAPIFVHDDTYLNLGAVGGYLRSLKQEGDMVARIILGLDVPKPDEAYDKEIRGYFFDDNALKRWHIADKALPANSIIINRKTSLFYVYRWYIALALLALIAESILILVLVRSLRHRKEMTQALAQERNLLEVRVTERTRELEESQRIANLGTYVLDIGTGLWKSSDILDGLFGINGLYPHTVEGWKALIHPDDQPMMLDYFKNEVLGQGKTFDKEYRVIRHIDRAECWVHGLGKLELDNQGHPLKMRGTIQDITERKQAETELRIAATAFESWEGMMITDNNGIILRVNHAFTKITGYNADDVIGKHPRLLYSDRHPTAFYADMWKQTNQMGSWEGEIWGCRKNGDIYPEHLTITAVKNQNGSVTNYVVTLIDITVKKAAEIEIERLAFYDPLTGLPNRRLLLDRLKPALVSSHRNGSKGAVLFIDMDNFKTLNDTLGHDLGDLLLKQVAGRLTACVREDDTVVRLGGDEFVVMLENLSGQIFEAATQAKTIGNKILNALNQDYRLNTYEYHSTPSIGITLIDGHEHSIEELLKQADIAMYQAKAAGRNALCFFDPQMQVSINSRVALETQLRTALAENQFILYYQPQVNHQHKIIRAEVLIRWQHPERGFVSPDDFIPLSEETGLILPIGQWVLETACAQIKIWESDVHSQHLQLAVNVSARQFHQTNFVAQVCQVLERSAINPNRLKLELTETLVLDNIEDTIHKMKTLRKIGVRFSMDDFGTGYSSLASLKKLPLDQIKIDQSFVRDIVTDPDDAVIVQTIIAMAHNLGMEVIAEGVETEAQRLFLEQHGCLLYQGYLFSKPIPLDEFELLLERGLDKSNGFIST